MIPANIKRETPLPIPFSVINSPSHIKRTVPAVTVIRDITISSKKPVSDLLDQLNSFDPAIYEVVYLYSHQDKHSFRIQFHLPEGITKKVEPKGPVAGVLKEIEGAIKLACYYTGSKNLQELIEAGIIFVTENGFREGLTRWEIINI